MNVYTWEELPLGKSEHFEVVVDDAMMDKFLALSGDYNPLHLDSDYATERGFRGRLVYGLLTASFYSTLAGVYLPGKRCLLHGLKADFNAPVYVGDRLRVSGLVDHRSEAYRRLELACEVTNQRAEVVSKARLRVGLDEH